MLDSSAHALDHFYELAIRGMDPGAGAVEQQAYRLATAVLADVPGLDKLAQEGLCALIYEAAKSRDGVREMTAVRPPIPVVK